MVYIIIPLLFLGSFMFATDNTKNAANAVSFPANLSENALLNPIKVRYTNYRGETAVRTIVPIRFFFGSTEYHPQEQWLVELWDVERKAIRVYALKEISQWFIH